MIQMHLKCNVSFIFLYLSGLPHSWRLLETPGNLRSSWKLLEKQLFFISPGNLLENHLVTRFFDFCEFCEVSVVLMRKKTVLPRTMSRMGSLITFKHCHSLVNLISVCNRFSDKIKHCLECFFDKINDCLE